MGFHVGKRAAVRPMDPMDPAAGQPAFVNSLAVTVSSFIFRLKERQKPPAPMTIPKPRNGWIPQNDGKIP